MVDGRPPPQHLLYLIACCVVGLWVGVGWDDGREELECRATDGWWGERLGVEDEARVEKRLGRE